MRKLFCAMAGLAVVASAFADTPLWLRYPAISPDGSKIAFCYQGDIFTVPAAGGQTVTAVAYGTFTSDLAIKTA